MCAPALGARIRAYRPRQDLLLNSKGQSPTNSRYYGANATRIEAERRLVSSITAGRNGLDFDCSFNEISELNKGLDWRHDPRSYNGLHCVRGEVAEGVSDLLPNIRERKSGDRP